MGIFSVIAEAKIKDWLKRKSTGEIVQSETIETIDNLKSIESYLLDDILLLIEQAAHANSEKREMILKKTREMEIRLLATLENDGYHLMAQMTAETIRDHRKKVRSANE